MHTVTSGKLLTLIGIIHNAFGIVVGLGWAGPVAGRNLFAEIAAGGVVGAIEPDLWRSLLFWFLFFGFVIMILGHLMHVMEKQGHAIPTVITGALALLALGGGLLIPASGFWLVLPVMARLWWRTRDRAAAPRARYV